MSYDPSAVAGGGAWTQISSTTVSNDATIDITLSGTHKMYMVHIDNLIPSTDVVQLYLRFSVDAGSTFLSGASDYAWVIAGSTAPTTGFNDEDAADSQILLSRGSLGRLGTGTAESLNGFVYIHNANQTTNAVCTTSDIMLLDSSSTLTGHIARGALIANIDEVDDIRFLASSGNLNTGRIALYGLNLS